MTKLRNLMQRRTFARRWSYVVIVVLLMTLTGARVTLAQTVNIDRVAAELEPEIQRTLLEGKIPSAAVALVAGDKIIWSNAYGYSNLWARTPATTSTVYLIGSTFKAMST
ncbi:MAG TPA: serine hydrolase, partial [Blastocatellia bacterium]